MASDSPTPSAAHLERLRQEEYAALRATIRERGTRRVGLIAATVAGWAALAAAGAVWVTPPVVALLPLLVLSAGFEAAFALHVGVERIGRYLQVEYEQAPGGPRWEHTAMAFGASPPPAAGRVDPLFAMVFAAATVINIALAWSVAVESRGAALDAVSVLVGLGHVAFLTRILRARAYAARQRELDLAALSRPRT